MIQKRVAVGTGVGAGSVGVGAWATEVWVAAGGFVKTGPGVGVLAGAGDEAVALGSGWRNAQAPRKRGPKARVRKNSPAAVAANRVSHNSRGP
jgi:hypothetical protein